MSQANKVKKVCIIAGEASGDLLGGRLMKHLKKALGNKIEFYGVGGESMKENGLENPIFDMKHISVMGIWEVIPHIPKIQYLLMRTSKKILEINPDIVITIDSFGFCSRLAKRLKKENPDLKLLHYVAPKVWAHKASRAKVAADLYEHIFALIPFEPDYFNKKKVKVTFVGHSMFEVEGLGKGGDLFRRKHKIKASNTLISVTPGSRESEIAMNMPVFWEAIKKLSQNYQNLVVVIPVLNKEHIQTIQDYMEHFPVRVIFVEGEKQRLQVYDAANCAIAKSGTNVMELSASGTPVVVGHKFPVLTWWFMKFFLSGRVSHASMVNIMNYRQIIPEYLQWECKANNIAAQVDYLLANDLEAKWQVSEAQSILEKLGSKNKKGASEKVADIIVKDYLK